MKPILLGLAAATTAALLTAAPVSAGAGAKGIAASGQFTGASDHITTGGVSIVKTANGGAVVILDSDFSLDGAPDPRVGFGVDGAYKDASDLGELVSKTGVSVYIVPPSVNVDDYNEVYIWCRKFAVPLGVAALK